MSIVSIVILSLMALFVISSIVFAIYVIKWPKHSKTYVPYCPILRSRCIAGRIQCSKCEIYKTFIEEKKGQ